MSQGYDSPGAILNVQPFPPERQYTLKPWMYGANEQGDITIWEGEADADADDGWIAGEVVAIVKATIYLPQQRGRR